jgi:hypothetical protein
MRRLVLATLMLSAWSAGCASYTTQITSNPSGARVFINGDQICSQTPCIWSTRLSLPRRYHLQIQRPGYREVDLYVDQQLSIPWFILASSVPYGGFVVNNFTYRAPDALGFQLEPVGIAPQNTVAPAPLVPAAGSVPAPAPAPER